MPLLCHLNGGLSPFTVWDLRYRDYLSLAAFADAWLEAQHSEE